MVPRFLFPAIDPTRSTSSSSSSIIITPLPITTQHNAILHRPINATEIAQLEPPIPQHRLQQALGHLPSIRASRQTRGEQSAHLGIQRQRRRAADAPGIGADAGPPARQSHTPSTRGYRWSP
ncbi:hypothetical protein M426DRAFT_6953 [Hypoxylon sp. CI-4A]|nr:hypothetical protein M426DRAFT_6953 [Hypoxylon sp. CI-4A]